jgi:hypothetical protein
LLRQVALVNDRVMGDTSRSRSKSRRESKRSRLERLRNRVRSGVSCLALLATWFSHAHAQEENAPRVYFEYQVERPVRVLGAGPVLRYPSVSDVTLREGLVSAEFVVDTSGRVDSASFRAMQSTDTAFVLEVRRVLAEMRFIPAVHRGRKVPQLVRQRFIFATRE